eukprot:scaffold241722_cov31-Tisochrysis_lutea.AAC.2
MPALVSSAKDGCHGIQGRANEVDSLVFREPVQDRWICQVFEDAVVVIVARRQVPARATICECRAVAGGSKECFLRNETELAFVTLSEGGANATHRGERVGAVESAGQRLEAEALGGHRAPGEVFTAHLLLPVN